MQSIIQKQGVWAERLLRMVRQLPEGLQKQKDLRDQAWLEANPLIQRWSGEKGSSHNDDDYDGDDESRESFLPWLFLMRWMTDWSFDAFENEPVFDWDMTRWLLYITGNVAIHQWSLDEEEKQLGQASWPSTILTKMVKTQTRWELTRGMEPLLAQMQEAAEIEVSSWKALG
ncbi:hypothetical protein PG994_008620 [Apiospora phragmitis]|uniref:Uncharacterized protein n=1 Tax=Apiospora phragmitis TaxID=2905665 RepID=A0ABR1UGZ1_9PEZI